EGLGVAVEQAIVDVLEHVVGRPVHDRYSEHRAGLGAQPDHDLLAATLGLDGERPQQNEPAREGQPRTHSTHAVSFNATPPAQFSSSSVRRKLGTNVSRK